MLKVKKHNRQDEWERAYRQAWLIKDNERAKALIDKAISRIPSGKCVYGWSGGKDALCLQVICEIAGVNNGVWGTIGKQWEYPSFWEFATNTSSSSKISCKNFDISEDFMIEHPELVFPDNSNDAYTWYRICNQRAYYNYAKECGAEYILLGHRTMDGNNCKSSKNGKVFPIYDFTHEDVFCILACNNIKLPDIYFYPNGFFQGTHAWIMRGGKAAMDEVYNIDSSLLIAHRNIPKINNFLIEKELSE